MDKRYKGGWPYREEGLSFQHTLYIVHTQFIECYIDDNYYYLKVIKMFFSVPYFLILRNKLLSKASPKYEKFITIVKKGSYKCSNERSVSLLIAF